MTKQKPIAWFHPFKNGGYQITPNKKYPKDQPLYTAREWINLTVQEREKLRDEYGDNPSGLISAVQMMLKEKNGN